MVGKTGGVAWYTSVWKKSGDANCGDKLVERQVDMTPTEFADAIRAYCSWSRASISSWGRSPERNAQVGGNVESRHLIWLAADVVYAPNPLPELAVATRMAKKLGITLIREPSHDHLQAMH